MHIGFLWENLKRRDKLAIPGAGWWITLKHLG
jgi:hypothetical protein